MKKEEKKSLFWGSIVAVVLATMFLVVFSLFGGWSLIGQQRFEIVVIALIAIAIAHFAFTVSIVATKNIGTTGDISTIILSTSSIVGVVFALAGIVALTISSVNSFFPIAIIGVVISAIISGLEINHFTAFSLLEESLILFGVVSAVIFLF